MKLRSYHTDSVEAAIRMAGIELGDGAVFLGSKRTADSGSYEVTFALVDEQAGATPSNGTDPSPRLSEIGMVPGLLPAAAGVDETHWRKFVPEDLGAERPEADGGDEPSSGGSEPAARSAVPKLSGARPPSSRERQERVAQSIQDLSQSVEHLRGWLEGQSARGEKVLFPNGEALEDPVRMALYAELTRQGVYAKTALALLSDMGSDAAASSEAGRARFRIEEQLERLCPIDSSLGTGNDGPKVVALVGPPGAGKTSTIAKLAVRYGLGSGTTLEFVAADPLRVGVVEPLEAYARLFGAPLTQLAEGQSLDATLDGIGKRTTDTNRPLVLIDTPGYGRNEWGHAEQFAASLAERPDVDVHLVLNLATKPSDLRRTIESYRIFEPSKLLFTNLDETETYGAALNEARRTGWPLSFFANGTRVPEDLAPVNAALLNRLLLARSPIGTEQV